MGDFTVTLHEDDLYRGLRLNAATPAMRPLALTAGSTVALLVAVLAASPAARTVFASNRLALVLEGALLLAILTLAAVLLARGPLWRALARRSLAQRRDLAAPVRWSFDDAALRIATRFTRSEYPWDVVAGWREDAEILLIYLSDHLFHALPKARIEEDQLEALRIALEGHGVPRR